MAFSATADWSGLAALLVLLLLPGLLVVRAPWPFVPFLSASFWIVSWWWLPFLGLSRHRFLEGALFAFGALALLRLAKPLRASWPSPATLLVLAAASLRLFPFLLWPVAPGADMSLHTLSTRLLVWRDGIPSGYEPLLPIHVFGAYTPGLHGLAADVALLSGAHPARTAFLVSVTAHALLLVALYALLRRLATPNVAAVTACLALGLARVPQGFFGWGGNPTVLALALLVAAAALVVRGRSISPAVAAGLLAGAALVCHTVMIALAALTFPLAITIARGDGWRTFAKRAAAAGVTALLAAGPYLLQLDYTLSAGERNWLADHLKTNYAEAWGRYSPHYGVAVLRYVVATTNDAFLVLALVGVVLALRRRAPGNLAGASSAILLLLVVAAARRGGLGPFVVFPERAVAVMVILLSVALTELVEVLWSARRGLGRVALAALAVVAVERTHRYYFGGSVNVMVGPDDLQAMSWLESNTGLLDVVCNDYRTAGLWVPALAGRAITAPQLPPFYFDEFKAGAAARGCAWTYRSERFFFGPPEEGHRAGGTEVFRRGTVRILKTPG